MTSSLNEALAFCPLVAQEEGSEAVRKDLYQGESGLPSRYLNSGYPGNHGIFPKAAHARTINAMMHFLGFPERVVADDRRHKYEASGCGSVGHISNFFIKTCMHP